MTRDEPFDYRLLNRGREVHECNSIKTCSGIEAPWFVSGWRQLNKRYVLTNCYCLGGWSNVPDEWTGLIRRECQRGFDFSVSRKVLRIRQVESAATRIQSKRALLRAL